MKTKSLIFAAAGMIALTACNDDDKQIINPQAENVELRAHSITPNFLKTTSDFSSVNVYPILSSEDQLTETPEFVYGSMADGLGLIYNADQQDYTLINNIEADYSIARITLDNTFKPVAGEYILNEEATGSTAQCSGSLITVDEHGFGPLYLSGGEWGGASKGVFATEITKHASSRMFPEMLTAMGQWSTENAVAIGKDAYEDKTVVFIGDDHSDNNTPSGQLGMYVGDRGDLYNGNLYGLKVDTAGINFEMDMVEGQSYDASFVELTEKNIDLLDTEAKTKGVMGFSRLEDIDWRRGDGDNQREIYFAVTGRKKDALVGKGSLYGRIYKVELNETDPTGPAKITCVLDGDKIGGTAWGFHSPDNILVTENYAYIQEDPNGYFDDAVRNHYARLYQYNLNTGEIKVVLECDQVSATAAGIGSENRVWEITGMIDVSDQVGIDGTFMVVTQNHGWEPADGSAFSDPNAVTDVASSRKEGSMLYVLTGLER
ncbi:alkaline phosphatase PhoX [uncultured Nonlabens sp.]|uniref:alkaline phosphatase PhoX n=1 Tax=uncultured Nonlabens sp. TaxID=859306 RepID=UPI002601C9C1|nr:alkaline phosphatase PhoX [uncultured Nonlabens sp.]